MAFVDFQALKSRVRIDDAIPMLGLQMKQHGDQWRGVCPACRTTDERALVITPSKSVFYCQAAKKGGDLISLWSHIRGIGARDAAQEIADEIGTVPDNGTGTSNGTVLVSKDRVTVPQNQSREPTRPVLEPLDY